MHNRCLVRERWTELAGAELQDEVTRCRHRPIKADGKKPIPLRIPTALLFCRVEKLGLAVARIIFFGNTKLLNIHRNCIKRGLVSSASGLEEQRSGNLSAI